MSNNIDEFVFPIPQKHLEEYKSVAEKVVPFGKKHGALAYHEFVGDILNIRYSVYFRISSLAFVLLSSHLLRKSYQKVKHFFLELLNTLP